jgi:hypothetical protein
LAVMMTSFWQMFNWSISKGSAKFDVHWIPIEQYSCMIWHYQWVPGCSIILIFLWFGQSSANEEILKLANQYDCALEIEWSVKTNWRPAQSIASCDFLCLVDEMIPCDVADLNNSSIFDDSHIVAEGITAVTSISKMLGEAISHGITHDSS